MKEIKQAAKNYANLFIEDDGSTENDFIAGALWQQGRSYSEEDLFKILQKAVADCEFRGLYVHYSGDYRNLKEWFEQYKKK